MIRDRQVSDRWHYSRAVDHTQLCEHGLAPTTDHGKGCRWQARWRDADEIQRKRSFRVKAEAETFLKRLTLHDINHTICLAPDCRHKAVSRPPVTLCRDHLDLLLSSVGRKRGVHDPVVYFARNGSRIKIGWSTHLKNRMYSLSLPMSAVELTLPGGPAEENMFHRKFKKARIGLTEWFEATPEMEQFIERQATAAA